MFDITVIMATYNSAVTVSRALESLRQQKEVSFQLIVVDGLSRDNTVEIVKEMSKPDILISEPDKGIGEAWNKGISAAEGKYIAFLNSDDVYPNGYLMSRLTDIKNCAPKTISFSDTILMSKDGKTKIIDGCLNENLSHGIGFSHTSCIFPKEFFDNYRFDEGIKVAIDIDQLFFAVKNNWSFHKADGKNIMFDGGVSKRYWTKSANEYYDLYIRHFEINTRHKMALKATLYLRIAAMKLGVFRFRGEIYRLMSYKNTSKINNRDVNRGPRK